MKINVIRGKHNIVSVSHPVEEVQLIAGVTPDDGLQNRTCEFPSIRLLNDLVNDNQTSLLLAERRSAADLTW